MYSEQPAMKNISMSIVVVLANLVSSASIESASATPILATLEATGNQPTITNNQGKNNSPYDHSYALIISMSDYTNWSSWQQLPGTEKEANKFSDTLRKQGFEVRRVHDQNIDVLDKEIKQFLNLKAMTPKSRIIFFFTGHGHYDPETQTAYLIPIDGADINSKEFYTKAYAMDDMRSAANRIKALHALFIFDNCFSGFITKSAAPIPDQLESSARFKALNDDANYKVRQFMSAGGPKQTLVSNGVYIDAIIKGIEGAASVMRDGYVTGKELAFYTNEYVVNAGVGKNKQRPGSVTVYESQGDMIFQYGSNKPSFPVTIPTSAKINTDGKAVVNSESLSKKISEEEVSNEIKVRVIQDKLAQARKADYITCKNSPTYLPLPQCENLIKEIDGE